MVGIVFVLLSAFLFMHGIRSPLTNDELKTVIEFDSFVKESNSDSTSFDTTFIGDVQKLDENLKLNTLVSENLVNQVTQLSFSESYENKLYKNNRSTRGNQISVIKGGGSSYRLMEFSRGLGSLLTMFEVTNDKKYILEALSLSERLISKSKFGKDIINNPNNYKDSYKGWENQNENYLKHPNGGKHLEEVPLFESYLFRYLAKMAFMIEKDTGLNDDDSVAERGRVISKFVEENGWEKWFKRGEAVSPGCYPYLFRSRTHMASHWAIVALYMRELTSDSNKQKQYDDFLFLYNKQLKANMKINEQDAYVWNMTWDQSWPYGTNCNPSSKTSIVQDLDHGNHVVTYIIESYELGKGPWSADDINHLVNTVKFVLYDSEHNRFYGNLDGKVIPKMSDGINCSDGFLKLARFDSELIELFERVRLAQYKGEKFNLNEPQYVAEIKLAAKRLKLNER